MRIVLHEMKKIWNPKLLLIIAVICVLFYFMFMEFNISYFPNGHPDTEILDYSGEMMRRYGATLEEEEFSEFIEETRESLLLEAEAYIKSMPVFAGAGIYSYEDYERLNNEETTELQTEAVWTLLGEECDFVQFKLQTIGYIEDIYYNYTEYRLPSLASEAKNERELNRVHEIQDTEEYRNIMADVVFDNTAQYAIYLAVLAILSVLVLISPLIVTDRMRNMHLLQYTAKQGRDIFKKQLMAVILSTFCLTTALLLIFGARYSTNGTWMFWDGGITSFLNATFLVNITYGQYIIIYIILLYTFCLGTGALAFVLSRFSQNPITLILKLIPVFAAFAMLSTFVFNYTFSISNILYAATGIWWIEVIVCGLLLILGLALALYIIRREKRVDVA